MAKYIELEAAIAMIRDQGVYGEGYSDEERENDVIPMLESIPSADVAPVVHGRWIDHMIRDWRCSLCGEKLLGRGYDGYGIKNLPNYCPNCGARMDGDRNDK